MCCCWSKTRIDDVEQQQLAEAVKLLRPALRARRPKRGASEAYAWSSPALNVLACVLSLNRNWDSFVFPRVENFRRRHPEIRSVHDLRNAVRRYATPYDFFLNELDSGHRP
jgi:hypothetical protein